MKRRLTFPLAALCFLGLGIRSLLAQVPAATPDENPEGNTGALKAQITTGGSYDAHSGNATRSVNDLHVPGALGVYGLDFTRYWNSIPNDGDNPYAVLPTSFGLSGWSHSWEWHALEEETSEKIDPMDENSEEIYTTAITITFPDGHASRYKITRSNRPHGFPPHVAPPDPRLGPPYTVPEQNSFLIGGGVHDLLRDMAADGSEFWLDRADGGAVHFTGGPAVYRAVEVFDPHGLRAALSYDGSDRVTHVEQDGGRFLNIHWNSYGTLGWAIDWVQSGGPAGSQTVSYAYGITAGWLTLSTVTYPEGAQTFYTYANCYGDYPCGANNSLLPLLKIADDKHYAGAMTKIRYTYRGGACQIQGQPAPGFEPYPNARLDYYLAPSESIASEKSDYADQFGPIPVSSFAIYCFGGTRMETNGLGGWRQFYYGRSAGLDVASLGYQLVKLTDFTNQYPFPTNLPFERQRGGNEPTDVWDGRNIQSQLVYADGSGQPSEIHHTGADGSTQFYNRTNPGASETRDPALIHNPFNHWLFSHTDERSLITTYVRDSRRRVKDINYADNSSEHFTYNDLNQVETHTLPSHTQQTPVVQYYHYNAMHQLDWEYNTVDGWDARKVYTYDSLEHVATVSDGRSRSAVKDFSTRMTYNGRHQVLTVEYAGMFNAANPMVTYCYDPYGNCTDITDELGHLSHYTYDSYRRCISYTEPLSATTSRTWNWYYDRYFDDNLGYRSSYSHTSKEWRVQVEPAYNAAGDRRLSAHKFDYNNRVIEAATGLHESADGSWHSDADTEIQHFTYDENGQKSSYTDPLGRQTTYEYDLRNRLWKTNETVNTIPRTTETLYDVTGNKTDVTFPDTRSQHWLDYDAFGQPGRFIDERGNTTNLTYQWGPMKKLDTVTTHRDRDAGGTEDQVTNFDYDGMGRPTWTFFPDGVSSEHTTYLFGQVDAFKTRKNQTKHVHYDARGREDYSTWEGDAAPRIDRIWDPASRLTQISNIFSTIDYDYDFASQPKYEGNNIAGSGGWVQTTFHRYPNGDLSNLGYPAGPWVRHDYTARGQLKTAGVADSNGNWQFQLINYYYHADGKVEHQDYGNGTTNTFLYDGRGFISSVSITRAGGNLSSRTYYRDARDRIFAWKGGSDASINPMQNGRGHRFAYDAEGQLSDAWYGPYDPENSTAGAEREDHLNYDALGNRRSWNDLGSRGWWYFGRRDNGLNQYSGWSPSMINYDGNGALEQEGNITANYNALNQPNWIWSPNVLGGYKWFGYDPLGRCVKRWNGGVGDPAANPATYYYYDGWSMIQEGPAAGSPSRLYAQGNRVDELAVTFNVVTSQYAFPHYDASANNMLLTDIGGNIMEQYYFDAFGKVWIVDGSGNYFADSSPSGNRFLFTGREWLQDLGLYDFRNRMYQPELGRFLQPDPKEFAAGDYNLYRYCHNDPVNNSDPFGLEPLAKGLIDIPEKALKQTYDNAKDAANQSLRNNDRRSQTERRTDTFNDKGKVRNTETTTGHKWPSPQAPPPKLPPGVPESARLTQAHDHVGSSAKHYGGDKASANDVAGGGRFPLGSGVSSTSDRGATQEFYIPSANQADRAANRGGGFFITNDGIHFTPAPYHP